ncbi:T-complex protein 10A homolog 1, partial [Neomonachus schauinslandi]|uniref:T-complex protein 10A homolog 1 n=1 Tax=Neomonachus schauinslandi TaxID=29088 RepID=A0A8M1M525_NEOSC
MAEKGLLQGDEVKPASQMLTAEEPTEPAETGCPEEGGGPGADPEDIAALSGEDGQAEQMLRLQQQVARLHEAFRSQESRWAAAQRQLQSQIDALSRQNQELRDGLKALGLPLPGAREADAAALGTGRKPDALVSRSAFGRMLPLSTDEETLVKHAGRRSHSATVLGQGPSSKHLPSSQ